MSSGARYEGIVIYYGITPHEVLAFLAGWTARHGGEYQMYYQTLDAQTALCRVHRGDETHALLLLPVDGLWPLHLVVRSDSPLTRCLRNFLRQPPALDGVVPMCDEERRPSSLAG